MFGTATVNLPKSAFSLMLQITVEPFLISIFIESTKLLSQVISSLLLPFQVAPPVGVKSLSVGIVIEKFELLKSIAELSIAEILILAFVELTKGTFHK